MKKTEGAEWLTISEAVNVSNYHADTLRELARGGKIKGRKIATVWQVERGSLRAYLERVAKLGEKRGSKKRS